MIKILFVCTGNICRSPSAEAVFRTMVERVEGQAQVFEIGSAGTYDYHVGERPDARSIQAAERRGFSMDGITARQAVVEDFEAYDYIVAMDRGHYRDLEQMQSAHLLKADEDEEGGQLTLFMDYCENHEGKDVPDPYYGGVDGFEDVLDILEDGVAGMIKAFTP